MKKINSKLLEWLILVPLFVLAVFLLYYAVVGYNEYTEYTQSRSKLVQLEKLKDLLLQIDDERGLATIYLSDKNNQEVYEKLKKQEETVDRSIKALKADPDMKKAKTLFGNLEELGEIRSKIKLHDVVFPDFFMEIYTKKFSYNYLFSLHYRSFRWANFCCCSR